MYFKFIIQSYIIKRHFKLYKSYKNVFKIYKSKYALKLCNRKIWPINNLEFSNNSMKVPEESMGWKNKE